MTADPQATAEGAKPRVSSRVKHAIFAFIGLLLLGAAGLVVSRFLRPETIAQVDAYVRALPVRLLLAAALLTAASYMLMTCYDLLSLRYVGRGLPYGRVAMVSFLNYAFINNLGFAVLTGSTIRYRFYSAAGLTAYEVAGVIAFSLFSFILGAMLVSGIALAFEPEAVLTGLRLSVGWVRPIGFALIAAVVLYLAYAAWRRTPFRVFRWSVKPPSFSFAVAQLALSSADLLLAAYVLYQLLPPTVPMDFPTLAGVYAVSVIAGFVSNVPGGLGVFEGMMVLLLSGLAEPATVLGCLLVFRCIYYLAPLAVAAVLIGIYEIRTRRALIVY